MQSPANPCAAVTHLPARSLSYTELGGQLVPRWPGGPNVAALGRAQLEWAFAFRLPGHGAIASARIWGYAPTIIRFRDGAKVSLVPENRANRGSGLAIASPECATQFASPPPSDETAHRIPPTPSVPTGFRRTAVSGYGNIFEAWVDPHREESIVTYRYDDALPHEILRVPLRIIAIGGLPDPHGLGEEFTIFGFSHGELVLATLRVSLRELRELPS